MSPPDATAVLQTELRFVLEELALSRTEGPHKQWLEKAAAHYQSLLDKRQEAT